MNTTIFRRLLWKEFRQQWVFWVAAVLIILMILGLASFVESLVQKKTTDFSYLGVVFALSVFYALGCGAMLFAGEHEEGTFEFQRNLPVSAFRVFLAKVVFAVLATAALACVLSLPAILADQYHGHVLRGKPMPWYEWGLLYVYILGLALLWGMLFSLLIKRVLLATFLGAAVGIACFIGNQVLWRYGFHLENHILALILFFGDVIVLVLANIWLGRRWFGGRSSRVRRLWAGWGIGESAFAASSSENMEPPQTATILHHLAWQQWRFSWVTMGVLLIVFVAVLILMAGPMRVIVSMSMARHMPRQLAVTLACIITTLLGASVFLGDQRGHSARFLAQRAVRPWHVWLSRQIVWLAPLSLIFIAVLFFHLFGRVSTLQHLTSSKNWDEIVKYPSFWQVTASAAVSCLIMLTAFAAGQLCSMLFRSGLLAAVFGLVLSGIFAGWVALMMFLHISPLWSVLPIAVGMLWATLLYTPDWMRERGGWRPYLRPAAAAVVPILVIVVVIPFYRVYSIPGGGPGFDVAEECRRAQSEDEIATVAMYREACAQMKPTNMGNANYFTVKALWKSKVSERQWLERRTAAEKPLVEANKEAIELALAASRRESCGRFVTNESGLSPPTTTLAYLLVMDGNRLAGESKLDLAEERFLGALRIASHLGQGTTFRSGEIIEGWAYDGLRYWAAAPGQTVERIKAAIKEIDAIAKTRPSRHEVIKDYHILARSITMDHESSFERILADSGGNWVAAQWYSLPWERARLLRMLDRVTANDLEALKNMSDPAVPDGREEMYQQFTSWPLPEIDYLVYETNDFFREPSQVSEIYGRIAFHELNMRTVRRATKIVLALEAWKLEHGELPETLDELVGPYFKKLPAPPRRGMVFAYYPKGWPRTIWEHPSGAGNYGPYIRAPFGPNVPMLLVCDKTVAETHDRDGNSHLQAPQADDQNLSGEDGVFIIPIP